MTANTTQAKIEGKFYPLQNKEWLTTAKALNRSELLILYHLRTLEPFGDKLTESNTKDVAKATGISQRSVQRALIKLEELELIDLQIQSFSFRLRSKHLPTTEKEDSNDAVLTNDTGVASATILSRQRQSCRVSGNLVASNDNLVASAAAMSQSSSETLALQGVQSSKTLQTLQTKKDFSQTLSEAEREKREILTLENSLEEEENSRIRNMTENFIPELASFLKGKEQSKKENTIFFNEASGRQQEAIIRTAQKFFLPRLQTQPGLIVSWIKCHAIEIAMTDVYKKEFDAVVLEQDAIEGDLLTIEDLQKMHPDCWKEMIPFYGAQLAF